MDFIVNWFDQLDRYLANNLYNFTCDDYSKLYTSFLKTHEQRSGTSENLTGFSEYLANRIFYYLLKDKKEFTLRPIEKVQGKEGYNVPDILIYENDRIYTLVSVKAFRNINNSIIKQDLDRINNIRINDFKSIMLNFFNHQSDNINTIYKYQSSNHKLLFLENNPLSLAKTIENYLFENNN